MLIQMSKIFILETVLKLKLALFVSFFTNLSFDSQPTYSSMSFESNDKLMKKSFKKCLI